MLLSTGTIVNGTPFSFVVFGSWYMQFVKSVDSEESMNDKKTEVNAYNGSESKRKKQIDAQNYHLFVIRSFAIKTLSGW